MNKIQLEIFVSTNETSPYLAIEPAKEAIETALNNLKLKLTRDSEAADIGVMTHGVHVYIEIGNLLQTEEP